MGDYTHIRLANAREPDELHLRLRALRAKRGLTLRDVAKRTGLAKETISNIERGVRRPHDRTLAKLAEGYGVTFEELVNAHEPEELPDSKPTVHHRVCLKAIAGWLAPGLDEHELAYLSNCLWALAEEKRGRR